MSSIHISNRNENVTNVNNLSQISEDLFEASTSPQFTCNFFNSPVNRINSQENSSETSEELNFIPRRKPRKALNFTDCSHSYSKKSSGSFRNGLNTSSSKVFRPISPECIVNESNSSSLLEVNQSNSNTSFRSNDVNNLSKENVEVISFVSESNHSDSSGILEDSLSDNQYSKKSFRTPIYSSVKKRTIREWLSNVSLNCPQKPEGIEADFKQNIHFESHIVYEEKNVCYKAESGNTTSEFRTVEQNKILIKDELEKSNDVTRNFDNGVEISKSNITDKYCPWLFDEYDKCSNENTSRKHEISYNISLNENCDKANDCNETSIEFSSNQNPDKLHERLELDYKERIDVSERNSTSNKDFTYAKPDEDNLSSADESDFNSNDLNYKPTKEVDFDDDSFGNVVFSKKKKKRNCLNISSDDSEAKDTEANDSEDIPAYNVDPYTPRRRLYFRNPLNNSLDDDAKPVIYSEDNVGKICANVSNKTSEISKNVLDQICSEVFNLSVNNATVSSVQNSVVKETSVREIQNNSSDENAELNGDSDTILHKKQNSILSSDEQFNKSQSNLDESYDFNNVSVSQKSNDSQVNSPDKKVTKTIPPFLNNSRISVDHKSSIQSSAPLDESNDSILHVKRKSKKNILNFSTDDDMYYENESNSNEININEIFDKTVSPKMKNDSPIHNVSPKVKTFINLVNSDDDVKYIYRVRSDSSSGTEEYPVISKRSLEDVVSIHTTTSEEDGDSDEDDDGSPWFDLETYLKKNVPVLSKSVDSSFSKDMDKRKARLAKIVLPAHSSCPNHTSFLLSLTNQVPDEMCHPDAVKYRESFTQNKNELIDVLFKLFNKEIFDDRLPPLEIKWSGHLTTTSGITKSSSKITKKGKLRSSSIKLSKTVVDDASKLRDVLLHELCHAANWLIDEQAGGHGPLFKKWVNKIWMKFPEVPKVKTTHHYELKWKYLYKCTYCGYELGKMKFSLNENCCRLCGGVVTVNT